MELREGLNALEQIGNISTEQASALWSGLVLCVASAAAPC